MSRFSRWIGRTGLQIGFIRMGRFKIILFAITGFKYGRLGGKLYEYRRFKPAYIAWGLSQEKTCLLRRYNNGYFRIEIVPIRIDIYAVPKDVWAHWQELKRKALDRAAVAERSDADKGNAEVTGGAREGKG